jgi:phosphate transport system permease protein
MTLRETLRRGDPAIWFTGTGLAISLLMITGMIALILSNGLGFFWPKPLTHLTLADGTSVLGEIVGHETVPHHPGGGPPPTRVQIKVGNRDLFGADFRWIDESAIKSRSLPSDAIYVERREYGPFIGKPVRLTEGERELANGPEAVWQALQPLIAKAEDDRHRIREIERDQIGAINAAIEAERLALRAEEFRAARGEAIDVAATRAARERRLADLKEEYAGAETRLAEVVDQGSRTRVTLAAADGTEKELATMMVMIMSLLAVPFGVLAALYLREYAKQGVLVRLVRIGVNNLAGVPSIVFGVFGLGFFVYFLGGAIDQAFYPERLPTPTFGTGGLLWASLTLGLLTVPVVIVASEEALAAVPRSMREASLATGATKFQTICRVVLPAAAPGVLTGLILAMARGAGEVAPLMITGVVKLAPDMPLDGISPFIHLERKFMHLGYHIYDVGFQSPNVEAAKPMVYATTILLLVIVVALNLTAIIVRNHLRKRYQTSAFS